MRPALVLLAACRSPKEVPPSPAPAPVVVADAAPPPIDAPGCLPSGKINALVEGSPLRYCTREDGRTRVRRCVAIERDGTTKRLPDDDWPDESGVPATEVYAPPGWTAKPVSDAEDRVVAIEACQGPACTKIPLALAKDMDLDDSVATIAIAPDGKTIAIDRGMETMGRSRLEIHRLSPPRLLRELKLPGNDCTNIVGYAGEYLVLQGILDCVNLGGTRALATPVGKVVKTFPGQTSAGASYAKVAATKWAFALDGGVEVWDPRDVDPHGEERGDVVGLRRARRDARHRRGGDEDHALRRRAEAARHDHDRAVWWLAARRARVRAC